MTHLYVIQPQWVKLIWKKNAFIGMEVGIAVDFASI